MARLITMLENKVGGISADTARSLLYVIKSRDATSVFGSGKEKVSVTIF
jgi:hypothetical protein